jgi:hypothetical protein
MPMSPEHVRPPANSPKAGERDEWERRDPHGLLDPEKLDEMLDQELEETFPASDPLPWSHRVD